MSDRDINVIHFNDRGPRVVALQRGLIAAGHTLPRYGADGHLGAETWSALGALASEIGVPIVSVDVARAHRAQVPSRLVAHVTPCEAAPLAPSRILPCETTRAFPLRGARAWLATRSDGARLHAGVDLGGSHDRIVAPEPLRVIEIVEASYGGRKPRFSRPAGWGGYGPHAVLCQALACEDGALVPQDRWHLLAHVDRVAVEIGDTLAMGDAIAQVAPIGAHLHWEVRAQPRVTGGRAVVEIVYSPREWLDGVDRMWTHGVDPCPRVPERTMRTPRACRPKR
jgi:hypothetical protein